MSQHDPNLPQNEKGSSMVKSAIKSILITALVLLSLVAAFFIVGKIITMTQREPSEPGLFERDANNGDVEVSVEYPNLLTAEIIIVAKTDIEYLQLEISFKNDNGEDLRQIHKTVGNLDMGERYVITVNYLEFSLSENMNIRYVTVSVEGGSVSLL